jgi:hypothetical protein
MMDFLDAIKTFFTDTIGDRVYALLNVIKKIDLRKVAITKKECVIFLSALFVFIFLFSLLFFLIEIGGERRLLLFFPEKFSGKLIGEERFVKNGKDTVQKLKSLFEELLLGPSLPESSPIFSKETEVISLVLVKNHVYLNFSKEILFPDRKLPLDIAGGLKACINSLKFNFPSIKYITFFIQGEELNLKLSDSSKGKDESGIRFDPKLLK